jgi:hypothetical protein
MLRNVSIVFSKILRHLYEFTVCAMPQSCDLVLTFISGFVSKISNYEGMDPWRKKLIYQIPIPQKRQKYEH